MILVLLIRDNIATRPPFSDVLHRCRLSADNRFRHSFIQGAAARCKRTHEDNRISIGVSLSCNSINLQLLLYLKELPRDIKTDFIPSQQRAAGSVFVSALPQWGITDTTTSTQRSTAWASTLDRLQTAAGVSAESSLPLILQQLRFNAEAPTT